MTDTATAPAAPAEAAQADELKLFVALGLRRPAGFNPKGAPHFVFAPLTPSQSIDGEESLFKPDKTTRKFNVGGVYEIPVRGGKTFVFGKAKALGLWSNKAKRVEAVAADEAVRLSLDADRADAKDSRLKANLAVALLPYSNAWARARNSRDRLALELLVLDALRGGVRL